VAVHDLEFGQILKEEDVGVKSPGAGISPIKLKYFIGRKLIKRNIKAGDYLLESDIENYLQVNLSRIKVNHRWGVVVRMADIDTLLDCNATFVEIHYTDMDVKSSKVYQKKYNVDLTLHGAEYNGDLLLDLSNLDENVRQRSIDFFNQVLEYSRGLKKLFKNWEEKIKFVVHPGGMNMQEPLTKYIKQLNNNLYDSLKKLNSNGFELLIENMPPLPWYFGGQWYHSSFMDAKEIVEFSRRTGYGIVFDISHAALYCNYYKKDFVEFTRDILPVTRHIHLADAAGFNGEGLRVGDGTINFKKLLEQLSNTNLTILMEIWQGHKFGGEGFVDAVRSLKKIDPNF
jgi:N-acetylneuraminate synthase